MRRAAAIWALAGAGCAGDVRDGAPFGAAASTAQPPNDTSPDPGISAGSAGSEDDGTEDDAGSDEGIRLDVAAADLGGNDGAEGSDCACAPKSDLVYLLSDTAELWLFDPATLEFTKLGSFDCGIAPTTFSMGVARNGEAWIMFQPSGDIYLVDVNDANHCEASGWQPQAFGYNLFGMGFASDDALGCDHLYLHSFDGGEWAEGESIGMLARVDQNTLAAQPVAPIDYNGGELTGTGDGRLFAFAGVGDAELVEYDRTDGTVVATTPLPNLQLTYAFAFAFWGGDFWFFTESGALGSPSKVTWLDHDESEGGGITTVVAQAPLRIVGAGVSTCAPVTPPG